jgi:uncharacterized membrane protein YeaQ/YmgE (transglycosylase-associated protein family)
MQIIGLILVGIVIGILARLILPGKQRIGMLWTVILGILGAVIGGMIASELNVGSVTELNFLGFLIAVITAAVLVAVGDRIGIGGGKPRDGGHVGGGHTGGRVGR